MPPYLPAVPRNHLRIVLTRRPHNKPISLNLTLQPRPNLHRPPLHIQRNRPPRYRRKHNRTPRPTPPKLPRPYPKLIVVNLHKQVRYPLKYRQHSTTLEFSAPQNFSAPDKIGVDCVGGVPAATSRPDFPPGGRLRAEGPCARARGEPMRAPGVECTDCSMISIIGAPLVRECCGGVTDRCVLNQWVSGIGR
jgi:hypothetical protein